MKCMYVNHYAKIMSVQLEMNRQDSGKSLVKRKHMKRHLTDDDLTL